MNNLLNGLRSPKEIQNTFLFLVQILLNLVFIVLIMVNQTEFIVVNLTMFIVVNVTLHVLATC